MSDYQTASLIGGLVLLVAIGARYVLSRPATQVGRDALYWGLIVAAIAVGYGIYASIAQ